MHYRNETGHRSPWFPLTAALVLTSLAGAFSAPVIGQEAQDSGQMGNQGVFDPRATNRGYYTSYDELRPGLREQRRAHAPRMYGPPPAYPRSTIYGEHSRYYGGPNYGHLRPGGPWGPGPMYDLPAAPRTGIYGEDSRLYGGPNYNLLR